jgi:hypothetical protein
MTKSVNNVAIVRLETDGLVEMSDAFAAPVLLSTATRLVMVE